MKPVRDVKFVHFIAAVDFFYMKNAQSIGRKVFKVS